MKKTAITELIEQLEYQKEAIPIEAYQKGLAYAIQAAKMKLETERQDHEHTFDESRKTNPMIGFKHETFEQYYKETYG